MASQIGPDVLASTEPTISLLFSHESSSEIVFTEIYPSSLTSSSTMGATTLSTYSQDISLPGALIKKEYTTLMIPAPTTSSFYSHETSSTSLSSYVAQTTTNFISTNFVGFQHCIDSFAGEYIYATAVIGCVVKFIEFRVIDIDLPSGTHLPDRHANANDCL